MSWYVLRCRPGQERKMTESLKRRLSKAALMEAFFFQNERLWRAGGGNWKRIRKEMFPGYVFLESVRPGKLSEELEAYRGVVQILEEPGYLIPVREEEESLLRRLCGPGHVMGLSYGYREKGTDHILSGPLKGLEGQIVKADWHRRFAQIETFLGGKRSLIWAGLGLPGEMEKAEKKEKEEDGERQPDKNREKKTGRKAENSMAQEEKATDFEKCVVCGKQTDVPKTKDISERKYYIEGAGQLCGECFFEIYGKGRKPGQS